MAGVGKILISIFFMCFSVPLLASQGQIVRGNGIDIWYETFGEKTNPPLLLVMGAFSQGILWPTEFCEQLAEAGFYVVRYDHRDAGLSTCFDYEKEPYDLLDMAFDAGGLLDALDIDKVHVCGLSMGGPIAELMAVMFEGRVQSLTLMATSGDFRPSFLAYDQQSSSDMTLPRPTEQYLQLMQRFLQKTAKSASEQLTQRLEAWSILNGAVIPFEEERYRELHTEFLQRLKHPESLLNHMHAIRNSMDLILEVPFRVKVPTVVIHGTEDPIFPLPHGAVLASSIKGAKLVLVDSFGHVPNSYFYPLFIEEIKAVANVSARCT